MSLQKKAYNGYVIFVIAILSILANVYVVKILSDGSEPLNDSEVEEMIDIKDLNEYKKIKCTHLSYKLIYPEKKIKNLQLIGFETEYGVAGLNKTHQLYAKILRSLRYQNITRKIEKKYGLKENLLLAIMMQETGGAELLPNSEDDGGIGLCHMQPSVAADFGLRTYENCKALRSKTHGKKLRALIKKHNRQIKDLIYYDDRFHPIINLDAVARMIAYYKGGKQLENTKLKTAIKRYAGRFNYKEYYANVSKFMEKLSDKEILDSVEYEFNIRNEKLKIDGKSADFKDYIKYCQGQNYNYGLNDYK